MSKLADLLKNSDFIFNAKQCFVLNFSHVTSMGFFVCKYLLLVYVSIIQREVTLIFLWTG